MNAVETYRRLLQSAHEFLDGTMADVTPAQLVWDPPGKSFSIGANYAHILAAEDLGFQSLIQGRPLLATTAWTGRTGASEPVPLGPGVDLKDWSRRATLDLAAMRRYGQAVHAASHECLASMKAEDLERPLDLSRFGFASSRSCSSSPRCWPTRHCTPARSRA
jgi:DinB superfamily